jgi:hypothetical protein
VNFNAVHRPERKFHKHWFDVQQMTNLPQGEGQMKIMQYFLAFPDPLLTSCASEHNLDVMLVFYDRVLNVGCPRAILHDFCPLHCTSSHSHMMMLRRRSSAWLDF